MKIKLHQCSRKIVIQFWKKCFKKSSPDIHDIYFGDCEQTNKA